MAADSERKRTNEPICTIAIPVYNRPEMVRQAIESALANQRTDIEVVVIDNCSTDGTYEAARSFDDPRLTVLQNPINVGLFGNFNRCLELARGKYVCILCSNDRHLPGFIDEAIAAMEANPSAGMLTSPQRMVDIQDRFLRTDADHLKPGLYEGSDGIKAFLHFQSHYARNVFALPSGCLFRKSVIEEVGRFRTDWALVADVELFLRVVERSDLIAIEKPSFLYRFHHGQAWAQDHGSTDQLSEHFALVEKYRGLLGERVWRKAMAQTCAVAMALAIKFRLKGMRNGSAAHWALAKSKGVPALARWAAFARLLFLRAALRVFGYRNLPFRPKDQALVSRKLE